MIIMKTDARIPIIDNSWNISHRGPNNLRQQEYGRVWKSREILLTVQSKYPVTGYGK